jgi:hypothetical protein
MKDGHPRARGTFTEVDDPDFGRVTVQAAVARLSDALGRIAHLGRGLGQDNDEVFGDLLGLDPGKLAGLPPREIAAAEEIVALYQAAEADGTGAIGHDGRLVDAAHVRLAANVLARAPGR